MFVVLAQLRSEQWSLVILMLLSAFCHYKLPLQNRGDFSQQHHKHFRISNIHLIWNWCLEHWSETGVEAQSRDVFRHILIMLVHISQWAGWADSNCLVSIFDEMRLFIFIILVSLTSWMLTFYQQGDLCLYFTDVDSPIKFFDTLTVRILTSSLLSFFVYWFEKLLLNLCLYESGHTIVANIILHVNVFHVTQSPSIVFGYSCQREYSIWVSQIISDRSCNNCGLDFRVETTCLL